MIQMKMNIVMMLQMLGGEDLFYVKFRKIPPFIYSFIRRSFSSPTWKLWKIKAGLFRRCFGWLEAKWQNDAMPSFSLIVVASKDVNDDDCGGWNDDGNDVVLVHDGDDDDYDDDGRVVGKDFLFYLKNSGSALEDDEYLIVAQPFHSVCV